MKRKLMSLTAGFLSIAMVLAMTACGGPSEPTKSEEPAFEMKPLVGEAWDYSDKDNWMFMDKNDDIDHEVDVFFLYPTSVSSDVEEDVCDSIDDMRENAHKSYIQAADTLSSFTNTYAPYYRQVSGVGIMKNPTADGLMETVSNNVTRTDKLED